MQITLSCPICEDTDLSKPYKFLPQDRLSIDCRNCGLSYFVEDLIVYPDVDHHDARDLAIGIISFVKILP